MGTGKAMPTPTETPMLTLTLTEMATAMGMAMATAGARTRMAAGAGCAIRRSKRSAAFCPVRSFPVRLKTAGSQSRPFGHPNMTKKVEYTISAEVEDVELFCEFTLMAAAKGGSAVGATSQVARVSHQRRRGLLWLAEGELSRAACPTLASVGSLRKWAAPRSRARTRPVAIKTWQSSG